MELIKKYFAWIVLASLFVALVWPMPGMYIKPYNAVILMIMMFFSCLKINLRELKNVKKDWWRYLVVLVFSFLWPVLVVYLARGFFDKEVFVGLIIVAAVPSAASVVFMADLLGGEPTKALVATTLAHLISPIVTPFLVWLTTRTIIDIGFLDLFLLICKLVLIPFALAQIVRWFKWHEVLAKKSQLANVFLLFFLNWGIIAPASALVFDNPMVVLWASVVVIIILLGVILAYIRFGRTRKEDITWAVVNTYKNAGLASVIVLSILPPVGLLGVIGYILVSNLAIVGLQGWVARFSLASAEERARERSGQ